MVECSQCCSEAINEVVNDFAMGVSIGVLIIIVSFGLGALIASIWSKIDEKRRIRK